MENKRDILEETLRTLNGEFISNGSILISIMRNLTHYSAGEDLPLGDYAYLEGDSQEGIFFSPDTGSFYYWGEPAGYSYGGRKTCFEIDNELKSLLPSPLQHILTQVATTRTPISMNYDEAQDLTIANFKKH